MRYKKKPVKASSCKYLTSFFLAFMIVFSMSSVAQTLPSGYPELGYSTSIANINAKSMQYAKSVGISCVETSLSVFVDRENVKFLVSEEEIIEKIKAAKLAADEAGIKIWSIHMPFSKQIDLSLADENKRKEVVNFHVSVLKFCALLDPDIILFHPSYFLGVNERALRKSQFVKSAKELDKEVRKMGSQMVIENMLGKDLVVKGGLREWPLCRDVAETKELMSRLPRTVGSAIDLNHIKNPEKLILAMGKRLKTLHVADGDGLKERHYFPCDGKGSNDWNAILSALEKVKYKGPFLYECHFKDVKDLVDCYTSMHNNYKAKR